MALEQATLPLLRYRNGAEDAVFEKPVTILGHIVFLDFDTATIDQGRGLTTEIYLEDLEDVLGDGDPDFMMNILLDAAEHNDLVKITLSADRLTYENEKQLARASA